MARVVRIKLKFGKGRMNYTTMHRGSLQAPALNLAHIIDEPRDVAF